MKAHKIWELRALLKEIWVRVTLFSLLGLVTALCGLWFNRYVPSDWADVVGAYNSVSTNVTPRATQLLTHELRARQNSSV